jgi:phosphoribosylanthranilate isomerase
MARARLDRVTLTGIDERIDAAAPAALARRYPLVEWAVLSSAERREARYPCDAWLAGFLRECRGARLAIHLCDAHVDAFVQGDAAITAKTAAFSRVQLNFNQRTAPQPQAALRAAIGRFAGRVILQHHADNAALVDALAADGADFDVLFDASSGRGLRPAAWPAPLARLRCGYAGGLGPANVAAELPRIAAAAGEGEFWIDMASSLRDAAGAFDLGACERVLEAAAAYL